MGQFNTLQWTRLEGDNVDVGDLVSAEAGGMPIYRVMAVDRGEAVVAEGGHPAIRLPVHRLHWKAVRLGA
jgi:hypothetical protein